MSKSTNNFDNSLVFSMEGPAKFFPVVLGFFVSTSYLTVETQAAEFLETINRSLITILIFWTFHQVIGPLSVVIKSVGGLLSKDLINWIIKAIKVLIFIYSKRSAESFIEIVKKYSLNGLMTESRVLCISEKVLGVLKKSGWKKLEVFQPGEELEKLKD